MKYLWIFVILCGNSAFGQNSYGTDYLNLHCTAPDPSAPPNFGDFPKPGLVPTSAATGNAILYCDASSSSIKVSFSGGAYAGLGGGGFPGSGTNPFVATSTLSLPAGAVGAPALTIGGTTDGIWQSGSHNLVMDSNGFNVGNFNGSDGIDLNPGTAIAWCNTVSGTCTSGANVYLAPLGNASLGATLAIGTSTGGTDNGLLRTGNECRVTADITLPVNTATTVCTWPLPAIAKAWAWQCQIPWAITAGTGTNTLAIIANPSQTPTAATNGSAEIKTTNTNTATEATVALSASGGTTLLTSPTITPGATVLLSSTSGTLLASATAGTFSIQMTAAGTTATAAAKAGATCTLY